MEYVPEDVEDAGFNVDVEVPEQVWKGLKEDAQRTRYSLASLEHKQEPTYRDRRPYRSLHLKDCRELDTGEDLVVELEHFNPLHRPVLHALVDFPLWLWRNRLLPRLEQVKNIR